MAAGTMCAVLYWFRVHLVDDITFENHPDNCRSAEVRKCTTTCREEPFLRRRLQG